MDIENLENIGLNKSESHVYLALIKKGSCKAGILAKDTGYNRTTVYKALESLIKNGLASFVVKENRKYFEASDPKNILTQLKREEEYLRQKKEEVQKLIPGLKDLFESNKEEMEATIFKGQRGIKAVFGDILKIPKGSEYLAFGVPAHAETMWGFFEEFNKILSENKVKCKIIFDERAQKIISSCKKYKYEVKTLGKEYMSPAEINIYGNKVAIILWQASPLAIVIQGKEIALGFKQYFRLLWGIAKKI